MYPFLQNCNSAIINGDEENTIFLRQTVFESNILLKMSITSVTYLIYKYKGFSVTFLILSYI